MKKITFLFSLLISCVGFSQNLITNGDFESGTAGWSGNALNVVTENNNSYNAANVAVAGNPWDVNLSYVLPINTQGTLYRLTFDAWSDTNRPLIAGIGLNQDPWTNTTEIVNLTAASQTFVLNIAANFSSPTSRIIFDMGNAVGFVGIDNVVIEVVTPTCTDGIMNGDETGVDCGGSCPNACLEQINLPVTFEGNSVSYVVTDFGGNSSSLVVDPDDSSNMVIKSIKTTGAQLWAGTTIGTDAGFSSPIPFTSANRKMYVNVWSPDAGIPVRLKVEVSGQPTQSCETQTNTTVANAWQTIEFNFNNEAPGTAVFNPAFPFNKASIFFNFGTDGATAGAKTYYFDNVNYGAALSTTELNATNVKMYPNPTNNSFTVEAGNVIENVSLFNVLGQKVFAKNNNSNSIFVNISNLQDGIYIVKTTINGIISTSRIIKK